jgi:cobalamin biosynthesis protein CobD/CbiB
MPGDIGAVATLLNTLAKWGLSEDGYAQWSKRRQLAALRQEAHAALEKGDLTEHRRLVSELERVQSAP